MKFQSIPITYWIAHRSWLKYRAIKLLISLILFIPLPTQAADNTEELVLSNGLKVIVKPDHRSPAAVFQIWYKVGSACEQEGTTGISHMLEHLMYKGTNNIALAKGFNRLNNIGARANAYTSRDHTFYYHILEKKHLALAFAVEAERMQNLSPSIHDFNIEKKVIKEERHTRIGKDPYISAYNALYEYAFKHSGNQFPVIGRAEDAQALTLNNTMLWYKNNYTPDNAVIVVTGDVIVSGVFDLARHYFAPIRKTGQPSRYWSDAKEITKSRFVMPETIPVGMLLLAFKVPSINTSMPAWEAYAMDVLAGWFDSNINSRLTRVMIRDKQLAHELSVIYSSITLEQSLFIIEAIPYENVSLRQLELTLLEEIKQIKKELISQQTLQEVKTQMIATEIFERDSLFTQAKIIGQAESVGIDWKEDAKYIARIKAVTAEQVKKVLDKYLIPAQQIVVIQKAQNVRGNLK